MRRRGIAPARNIDFVTAGKEKLQVHAFGILDVAHCDRATQRMAVGAGGGVADDLVVAIDWLTTPEDWLGVLKHKGDELALEAGLFLLKECIAAEECGWLFPGDEESESGF